MNARVLVTGCSSGLGMHTAVGLAAAGFEVVATMRDVSKRGALDQALQARNASVNVLALDVASLDSVTKAFSAIRKEYGGLDVLINNAGVTRQGFLERMSDDHFLDLFQTNVFGVIRVTRAALPLLRESPSPRIINVSSLAGLAGYPGGTAYATSKWAVEGFTESLYYELLPLGIKVCLIEPGGYKTEIYQANANHVRVPPGSVYEAMDKALAETYDRVERREPAQFVEALLKLIQRENPPLRTRIGADAQLTYVLRKILPFRLFSWLFWKITWKRMAGLPKFRNS